MINKYKPLLRVALIVLLLIFIPLKIYSVPDIKSAELRPENMQYYQENKCSFSLFDILENSNSEVNFEIYTEPSGSIECFGKHTWMQYIPEQLIENGWDEYKPAVIKVWIGSNINIDLILQSIFWLLFISLIPKSGNKKPYINRLSYFFTLLLFYLHLVGEKTYYKSITREYDIDLISREFNGDLYYENYFLYLYFLTILLILFTFSSLLNNRFENLLNYFPFIFLFYGTYNSLNINFYLIIFSFLGINSLLNKNINKKFISIYFMFSILWILNLQSENLLFDVDKLRGFTNSTKNLNSLIFWIILFYFLTTGIYYLFKETYKSLNLDLIIKNFLISGSLIFLIGSISSTFKLFNFVSYYFLGLNKFGMRSIESIEGNTWRGIASSAEGMGEYFAFVILLYFLLFFRKIITFSTLDFILLIINLLGLIRTNNFAAISSMTFLLILFYILNNTKNSKKILIYFILLCVLISGFGVYMYDEFSFQYLSNSVIYEGIQASEMNYEFKKNQYGQSDKKLGNYSLILNLPEDSTNMSSSLRFMVENYTNSYNIPYLPSINSSFNTAAYFINRSEKWGIFLAKYNPNLQEFLFGYGPQQLTHYYFDHYTKYNYGLFLPHSSLFNYLIFFGVIGLFIMFLSIFIVFKNKYKSVYFFLILFLLLNFLKSDALLYIPNYILLLIVCFMGKYPSKELS